MELTEKQIEKARSRMIEGVQVSEILIRDLASMLAPAPQPVDGSLVERAWRAYERVMGAKGYTCTAPQGTKDGHAAFGEVVAVVQADHKAEIAKLREALIQAGRNAGCLLADDVSTDFLMHIPAEIAALKAARDNADGKYLACYTELTRVQTAHVKELAEQRDVLYAEVGPNDEAWQKTCIWFKHEGTYGLTIAGLHHFFKLRRAQLDKPEPTLEEEIDAIVSQETSISLHVDTLTAIANLLHRSARGKP